MNLDIKIENMISNDSNDFDVAKQIKQDLKSYSDSLESMFQKDQGKSFLVKHTKEINRYIKTIFKYSLRKHFGDFLPLVNTFPVTVISLGSYAREQLCVFSDIDVMIVYKKSEGYNIQPFIETILQVIWDSGLKLSHRVHEIDDLLDASREDHTIKSAFIESCYLCGSKYLWTSIQAQLNIIRRDNQKAFIEAKIRERDERIEKYPFHMQPDIKSTIGGLRDFNTLYWIGNSIYGISKVKDLNHTILTDDQYGELMKSVEFLFRIRIALHLSANKKQDQLIFQYIPEVARRLNLSQVKLMQKSFAAMLNIQTVCDYLIKKISSKVLFDSSKFGLLKNKRLIKNIYKIDNYICSPSHVKKKNLVSFLKYFLEKDDEDLIYSSTYINYLKSAKKERINPKIIKELFYKRYLYQFFIALYRANQLNNIFPSFKKITHLPQFDGYHKFPVDIHSIRTLLALENINDTDVLDLFSKLDEDEKALLRVVSFLHDSGKGRKKDHSILGAGIAKKVTAELGFSKTHQEFAYTLVRHHTLMSNIASRSDIYSEKIIFSFISKLNDLKVLKLLYILTFADIESVGKGVYSNFNAKLLNELFTLSQEAFENRKLITEAQKRSKKEAILKRDLEFKGLKKALQKKILAIESNLLFFKYNPNQIVKISSWIDNLNDQYDYIITNSRVLTIEIIRKQSLNLGYLLGKLNNLNIATMDIFKFFNKTKYFRVEFLEPVEDFDIPIIEEIIKESFDMSKRTKHKALQIKRDEITINCNHSKTYAMMSVNTKDQPALLSNIMSIFDDIGIDIASAKIQTIKNRARNLILIEKNGNFCVNQDVVINKLVKGI